MRKLALILALAFGITLSAQTQRILLPIRPLYVSGALGSAWLTEVGLANLGDTALTVYGLQPCTTEGCPSSVQLAAHSTGWAGLIGGQCSSHETRRRGV